MVELHSGAKAVTDGQKKWLVKELRPAYRRAIMNKIRKFYVAEKMAEIHATFHLVDKIASGRTILDSSLLNDMLANENFELIEINQTRGQYRALIRSTNTTQTKFAGKTVDVNQCIVLSLSNALMITAYVNETNDNHQKIRHEIYEDANTFQIF